MTNKNIIDFGEEKFVMVKSILDEKPMSRVALMRYLVKLKASFAADQEEIPADFDVRENAKMLEEINVFLAEIDDEDYRRLFYDRESA